MLEFTNYSTKSYPSMTSSIIHFCSSVPGVDLTDRNVEAKSNIFNGLIALRDDTNSLGNSFGCDGMVTSHHNNLQGQQGNISSVAAHAQWK